MARLKLRYDKTETDLGAAIVEAAKAYLTNGPDQSKEQNVKDLLYLRSDESVAFHYDGEKEGSYFVHIALPDVSTMIHGGKVDPTDFANELLADLLERGCAQ
jgi:hypothetical protein